MKRMRKLAAVCAGFILLSSSGVFAGSKGEKAGTGPKRVAYIARAQDDSFAAWLANSMKEEAKKYPNLKVDVLDGQANDAQQNHQIENCITSKYDLIIIQPNDSEAQKPSVRKAAAAKIPVILTNPRVSDPEIMKITNSVDADPYEQAAVVARLALTQVPQGAKAVVLNGPPGNIHSTERRRAWKTEFFDKRADVVIAGEQAAYWLKDQAMRYMEGWVQANPQIDAVIAMNDNMAAGAIEVIKGNPQFDNLLTYGGDGTVEAALLIRDGALTATFFQNAMELAKQNMDLANKMLAGAAGTGGVHTDIQCPLITKENIQSLIDTHKAAGADIK
ncbi:MAG: sugar ABC transporter substrate-binding protein [Spirochaetaceae bacterium]|nr:sugar ABC transporter substrate-binding protein [Spirochaetaceae bacterium]